jgi:hypothetical protein
MFKKISHTLHSGGAAQPVYPSHSQRHAARVSTTAPLAGDSASRSGKASSSGMVMRHDGDADADGELLIPLSSPKALGLTSLNPKPGEPSPSKASKSAILLADIELIIE